MKETWKDIPNYEGLYQVSNLGKVKSLLFNKEKILKTRLSTKGYELINLKGKTFRVHTLVANTFLSNPNNYKEVNHKNERKADNNVDNLEWCSRKYNCNYGSFPKQVCKRFSKGVAIVDEKMQPILRFSSALGAEKALHIDHSSIIKCCNGKLKTAGGYVWRYLGDEA